MLSLKEELLMNFTDVASEFWRHYQEEKITSLKNTYYRNYIYTMDLIKRVKAAEVIEPNAK